MQVILLKRILGLGQIGDTVRVRPGYARNFLLPRAHALRATKSNLDAFATRRHQLEADNLKEKKEAEMVGAKLEGEEAVIIRQASESGRLYGSVTTRDIVESLDKQGFTVDRSQIQLGEKIKSTGIQTCRIVLHAEVISNVSINIARSKDEATAQRKALESPPPPPPPKDTDQDPSVDALSTDSNPTATDADDIADAQSTGKVEAEKTTAMADADVTNTDMANANAPQDHGESHAKPDDATAPPDPSSEKAPSSKQAPSSEKTMAGAKPPPVTSQEKS